MHWKWWAFNRLQGPEQVRVEHTLAKVKRLRILRENCASAVKGWWKKWWRSGARCTITDGAADRKRSNPIHINDLFLIDSNKSLSHGERGYRSGAGLSKMIKLAHRDVEIPTNNGVVENLDLEELPWHGWVSSVSQRSARPHKRTASCAGSRNGD